MTQKPIPETVATTRNEIRINQNQLVWLLKNSGVDVPYNCKGTFFAEHGTDFDLMPGTIVLVWGETKQKGGGG
jgi:hypothetical protein